MFTYYVCKHTYIVYTVLCYTATVTAQWLALTKHMCLQCDHCQLSCCHCSVVVHAAYSVPLFCCQAHDLWADCALIAGLAVWYLAPPVHMWKCPWARQWTPNLNLWMRGKLWSTLGLPMSKKVLNLTHGKKKVSTMASALIHSISDTKWKLKWKHNNTCYCFKKHSLPQVSNAYKPFREKHQKNSYF